ncbi:MAG: FlgD immunoglobulin-like domain containing protein [Candidatus Zhuqueibacterota bacterium]
MKRMIHLKTIFALIPLCLFLSATLAISQEYVYTIGGAGQETGFASYLDNNDSTLTVIGSTDSEGLGGTDAFIAHYIVDCVYPYLYFRWAQVIGSTKDDHAYDIKQDSHKNYIVCGSTVNPDPNALDTDALFARIDKKGQLKFARRFDIDGAHKNDHVMRVIEGHFHDYILVGTTKAQDEACDLLVAAIDTVGSVKWGYIIGKPDTMDVGYSIVKDSERNYVVLGTTGNLKSRNILLIKINGNGIIQATREIGAVDASGAPLQADIGYDIVDAPNQDSYVITGGTRSLSLSSKIDLLVLSVRRSLMSFNWNTILTSPVVFDSTEIDEGHSIIRNENDELIVAGLTETMSVNPPKQDMLLVKFDSTGNYISARRLHPILDMVETDMANDVVRSQIPGYPDGYIAIGTTESAGFGGKDILLASFNELDYCCYENIPFNAASLLFSLKAFGPYRTPKFVSDSVFVKTIKPDTTVVCYSGLFSAVPLERKAIQPKDFVVHQNYPNPFNPSTEIRYSIPGDGKVEVAVFDLLGKKVATLVSERQQQGFHSVTWDGKDESGQRVSSGVYLFTIKAGDHFEMKKMIMVK